jgi:tRNA(Arg) A34 adenosine deaminase TadA
LISAVYERDPRWARRIIRNRISSTEAVMESSWGTVKVAARRIDYGCRQPGEFAEPSVELVPGDRTADEVLAETVMRRIDGRRFRDALEIWTELDQLNLEAEQVNPRIMALPVSALLLDSEGSVLSWGVNSAWDFRPQHAETNLIRRWYRQGADGVPAALWVTRKPCKMCSGWIWDSLLARHAVSIHYRDPDDGPLARTTVLDAGTFERRRAEAARRGGDHASG